MKQNAPQDAHLAERKSSLRDPLGRERVASDSFLCTRPHKGICLCGYGKDEVTGMKNPTVDVIIPTYKPDENFLKLIERLEKQTYPIRQIIIMNTEEKYFHGLWYGHRFELEHNVSVSHISKMEFDHGHTRKEAVKKSKADIFICMTDDAMPKDTHLIENLIAPIVEEKAEFSYARQLAREDAGAVESFTRQFNYPKESRIKSIKDLDKLGIKTYFFSNVCAAYRRDLYDELGGFVDAGNVVSACKVRIKFGKVPLRDNCSLYVVQKSDGQFTYLLVSRDGLGYSLSTKFFNESMLTKLLRMHIDHEIDGLLEKPRTK